MLIAEELLYPGNATSSVTGADCAAARRMTVMDWTLQNEAVADLEGMYFRKQLNGICSAER